jgi:hypothetical protein
MPYNQLIEIMDKPKPSIRDLKPGADAWRSPTVNVSEIDFPAFLEKYAELCLAAQVAHILEKFNFSEVAGFFAKKGDNIPLEHLKREAEYALKMAVKEGRYRGQIWAAQRHGNWLELYVPAFSFDCSHDGPSTDLAVTLYSLIHRVVVTR